MKIIHGSLSALLTEVKEHGKVDGVRVAAMMESTIEGAGVPRYTSWVIVSAHVDWEKWAEWRLVVGQQRAEVTEHGFHVPDKLAALTEEKLAEPGAGSRQRGFSCATGSSPPMRRRSRESWASVRATGTRPAGADNYLRWRRTIDEHLELRRISWHEYAMFSWLCTKADPRTGRVRTSWPVLAEQTGLAARHVEKLCRGLRRKGYVAYPTHQGKRRVLVELAINKFPLMDGSYTALRSRGDGSGAEARAETTAKAEAEVPAQLGDQKLSESATSLGGRSRKRERDRYSPRVRSADDSTDIRTSERPAYPPGLTRLN